MERLSGLFGFFLLLGIAFACSTDRKAIRWKTVFWGITLQLICALVVLKGEWLGHAFDWLPLALNHFFLLIALQLVLLRIFSKRLVGASSALPRRLLILIAIQFFLGLLKFNLVARFFVFMRDVVNRLIAYSSEGATFVFGPLGSDKAEKSLGFVFAFQVLPTIIFVASIFAILYYLGLMQAVVKNVSRVNEPVHGFQRRRICFRGGQHLHGSNRGAFNHSSLPGRDDPIRADDGDDGGYGARFRGHHGCLCSGGSRRRGAPADGRSDDGARSDHGCQDHGS